MKYLPLNPAIFINNRKRFIKEMLPNSIAVFVSNDEWPSNGDALHAFKQNTDLFWLSGVTQEDSMVILFPDNPDPKYREVLVLVRPNELKEKWDGKRLRAKEAAAMSDAELVVQPPIRTAQQPSGFGVGLEAAAFENDNIDAISP